ncbi:MAG TPA: response regulator transcription factor [Burkholderiales bacterium]|nr:response regulator transcription factor [Burkholderiales bacterium]
MAPRPIRVLLADDHVLVRAGIRSLLDAMAQVEVVGEAGSGEEALALAAQLRPDVVVMDIAMKGMNGLEATTRLRDQLPEVRVIVLSMYSSEEYVLQALRAGAAGYLVKDAATAELERTLRGVVNGETWLSPSISRQTVDGYARRMGADAEQDALTPRQLEVLRMIARGRSTKEIAYELNLSVKTVETHRAQIMERLAIRDVAGLVRYAIRTGLVAADM